MPTCLRCSGLLVAHSFFDINSSPSGERDTWFHGVRCLNCGDIFDPLILERRQPLHPPEPLLVGEGR